MVDGCARELIRSVSCPMSADFVFFSECVSKCGSEKADHCLSRPVHHLLSFKRLGFSENEEVKYNRCVSH